MKTLICDCNKTMPLDSPALMAALAKTPGASTEGLETVHTLLCRREASSFQRAAKASGASGDELLVACTQEQRLFLELNEATEGAASVQERPIHFVNIRETGGWSRSAKTAMPKIAALIAAAQLPPPEPVPTVSYRSSGRCLVLGGAQAAEHAARLLGDKLDVSVLVTDTAISSSQMLGDSAGRLGLAAPAGLAQKHDRTTHVGELQNLTGWLGAFHATWQSNNPIDLDLCTRCNACLSACPEGAINFHYQVDLAKCKSHRECVRVCEAAGAIDFNRGAQTLEEDFDLVLDLRVQSAFAMHQPPQGYFHVGSNTSQLTVAVLALRDLVGEFDKPKFFRYQQKICAHSRNEKTGCTACIDVCSAQAIRSDASLKGKGKGRATEQTAGGIVVEPHLCVGCGACTTVCPSGALSFAYPGAVDTGKRMRTMLTAYASGGGKNAALLLHSQGAGVRAIDALGRAARVNLSLEGVPARVLPLAVWHTASIGIDLWLAAIAQGANQVWVLLTDEEAPQYEQALLEQMAVAQALLSGLGFAGEHFALLRADDLSADLSADLGADLGVLDKALRAAPAQGVARAANFAAQADKRNTLELALDHLLAQSPQKQALPEAIALPSKGSPYGSLAIDTTRCTLCLSCVSACPEGALADNADKPQLKFIEKNCVQCGLCAKTCPEDAITLQPRLWLLDGGKARKAPRVINEMAPYQCVRCAKPFGTLLAIENMLSKLAGHSAFQGAALERLKMCADCRVIDLYSNPGEVRITDI